MGSTLTLDLRARTVAEVLTCDDITSNFFREELEYLPSGRDNDSLSISTTATTRTRNSAFYSLRNAFSRLSVDSLNLEDVRKFALSELCQFIADHPSLQTASIVSCSCYVVPSAVPVIPHRFLILQLRRQGRQDVWLRLDRLRSPDVGLVELALMLGATPSNDRAMLASSPERLLPPNARQENELAFRHPYPLSKLRSRLLDVIAVMDQYKLTSENCWAFCSLLQRDFTKEEDVTFRMGQLRHHSLAQNAHLRLFAHRYAAVFSPDDPSKFIPFSILLRNLKTSHVPGTLLGFAGALVNPRELLEDAREALFDDFRISERQAAVKAASIWEDSDGFESPQGQLRACELAAALDTLGYFIEYDNRGVQLLVQTVALCRQIVRWAGASWPELKVEVTDSCIRFLTIFGSKIRRISVSVDYPKIVQTFEEAASLVIPGVTSLQVRTWLYYEHVMSVFNHGAEAAAEAEPILMKFVECCRHDPELHTWHTLMDVIRTRGSWPSEFNYLFKLRRGDLVGRNPNQTTNSQSQDPFPSSIPSLAPSSSITAPTLEELPSDISIQTSAVVPGDAEVEDGNNDAILEVVR